MTPSKLEESIERIAMSIRYQWDEKDIKEVFNDFALAIREDSPHCCPDCSCHSPYVEDEKPPEVYCCEYSKMLATAGLFKTKDGAVISCCDSCIEKARKPPAPQEGNCCAGCWKYPEVHLCVCHPPREEKKECVQGHGAKPSLCCDCQCSVCKPSPSPLPAEVRKEVERLKIKSATQELRWDDLESLAHLCLSLAGREAQ